MKKIICFLFVVTLITGCTGIKNDTQRTQVEGAGIGAAGGAAIGALLGQAIGRDTNSTLIGAAVGTMAGAAAGGMYGNRVAQKKIAYANMEDYYNACIASARKVQRDGQQYNAYLRYEIQKLNQEVNQVVASYKRRILSKQSLEREQRKVRGELNAAKNNLAIVQHEIAFQKQVVLDAKGLSSSEIAELDRQIGKLEQTAKELGGQTMALASLDERVQL